MSQKSAECVWVSPSFSNPRIFKKLRFMLNDVPGYVDTKEETGRIIKMIDRYEAGYSLTADEIPQAICGKYKITWFKTIPDFFFAVGFFFVSERCGEVFRRFDLGTGGLFPVEIYQGNCKTRLPGSFFLLNFGCRKTCFLPQHSNEFHFRPLGMRKDVPTTTWMGDVNVKDDECVVSRAALDGPDLWIDPRLKYSFFMSDRLRGALKTAKVTRTIMHMRCRILDEAVEGVSS